MKPLKNHAGPPTRRSRRRSPCLILFGCARSRRGLSSRGVPSAPVSRKRGRRSEANSRGATRKRSEALSPSPQLGFVSFLPVALRCLPENLTAFDSFEDLALVSNTCKEQEAHFEDLRSVKLAVRAKSYIIQPASRVASVRFHSRLIVIRRLGRW